MAPMVVELHEALRLANVPDDQARAAARAGADLERRIGKVGTRVAASTVVLTIMLVLAVADRPFRFF